MISTRQSLLCRRPNGLGGTAKVQRGTLSDGDSDGNRSVTSESRSQVWDLDPLGNWDQFDQTGGGSNQNCTQNRQNQREHKGGGQYGGHDPLF